MSVRQETRLYKLTVNNHEYVILRKFSHDTPWDDDWDYTYTPTRNYKKKGKNWKKREIFKYQVRMYRTWKHTRKHQWKDVKNPKSLHTSNQND